MAPRSRVRARASNDAADRSRVPNLAHVLAVTALAVVVALYVSGSAHGRVTRPPPIIFARVKGTEKMTTSASASLGSHPASRKLTVENLILGCSPLAGIYASSTPERATATVRTALEAGFTRFDTAPHYGLGLSERRLGDALRECGADMSTTRVYTKVGRVMKPTHTVTDAEKRGGKVEWGNVPGDPGCIFPDAPVDVLPVLDYTGPGFRRSHDDSLQRMGIERVDGLRIHDAEDEARYNEAVNGGGVAELVRLREAGFINEVSLGMNDAYFVQRMLDDNPHGTFDSVMMAGSWNLLDQDGLLVLLECERRGVKVHNAGIFASGLLVGGSHYKYGPAPPEIVERTERWKTLAAKYDVPLPAVAIAFACAPSVVDGCAVGVKSPDEVLQNVAWLADANAVPMQLWADAKSSGLLAEGVPVPGEL